MGNVFSVRRYGFESTELVVNSWLMTLIESLHEGVACMEVSSMRMLRCTGMKIIFSWCMLSSVELLSCQLELSSDWGHR